MGSTRAPGVVFAVLLVSTLAACSADESASSATDDSTVVDDVASDAASGDGAGQPDSAADTPRVEASADSAADAPVDAPDAVKDAVTSSDSGGDGDTATSPGDGGSAPACTPVDTPCGTYGPCCSGFSCHAPNCEFVTAVAGVDCTTDATCGAAGICIGTLPVPRRQCFGPVVVVTAATAPTPPSGTITTGLGSTTGGKTTDNWDFRGCTTAADCGHAYTKRVCVKVSGLAGGICSLACTSDADCTPGACVAFGGQSYCLGPCTAPLLSGGCFSDQGTCKTMSTVGGGSHPVCSPW